MNFEVVLYDEEQSLCDHTRPLVTASARIVNEEVCILCVLVLGPRIPAVNACTLVPSELHVEMPCEHPCDVCPSGWLQPKPQMRELSPI